MVSVSMVIFSEKNFNKSNVDSIPIGTNVPVKGSLQKLKVILILKRHLLDLSESIATKKSKLTKSPLHKSLNYKITWMLDPLIFVSSIALVGKYLTLVLGKSGVNYYNQIMRNSFWKSKPLREHKYQRKIKDLMKFRRRRRFFKGPRKLRNLLQIKSSFLKLKKLRSNSLRTNAIPSKYLSKLLKRNALRSARRRKLKRIHKSRRRFKKGRRLKLYKFNRARIHSVNSLKKIGYLNFFTKGLSRAKKKKISLNKLRISRRSLITKKSFLNVNKKIRSINLARYDIRNSKLDINYRKLTVKKASLESRFLLNDLVSLDLLGFYNIVEPVSYTGGSAIRHPWSSKVGNLRKSTFLLKFIKNFDLKLIRSHLESTKFLENKPSADLWDNSNVSLLTKRVLLRQLKSRYFRALTKLDTSSRLATDKFINSTAVKFTKPTLTNSKLNFKWSDLVSNDSVILSKTYNDYTAEKRFSFMKKHNFEDQPSGADIFLNMSSMEFVSQVRRLGVHNARYSSLQNNYNECSIEDANLSDLKLPCVNDSELNYNRLGTASIQATARGDSTLSLFLLRAVFRKSRQAIKRLVNRDYTKETLPPEEANKAPLESVEVTKGVLNERGSYSITLEEYKRRRYMDPEPESELPMYPSSDEDTANSIRESDAYYQSSDLSLENPINPYNLETRPLNLKPYTSLRNNSVLKLKRVVRRAKVNRGDIVHFLNASSARSLFKKLHLPKTKTKLRKPHRLASVKKKKTYRKVTKSAKSSNIGINIVSALRSSKLSINLPPRLSIKNKIKKTLKAKIKLAKRSKKKLIKPPVEIKNMILLSKKRVLKSMLSERIGFADFIKREESKIKDKVLQYFFMRKKKKTPTNPELKTLRVENRVNMATGIPVDYYKAINKSKKLDSWAEFTKRGQGYRNSKYSRFNQLQVSKPKKVKKNNTKLGSTGKVKFRSAAYGNLKLTTYLRPQKWFARSVLGKKTKVSRFKSRYLKLPNKPYPAHMKFKKNKFNRRRRKYIDLRVYRRLQINPSKIRSRRVLLKYIRKSRLRFGYSTPNCSNAHLSYRYTKPKTRRVLPRNFISKARTNKPLVLNNAGGLKASNKVLKKIRAIAYKKTKFIAESPDVSLVSSMLTKLKPKLKLVTLEKPNRPSKILNSKLYTKILNKKKSKHYLSVLMGLSNDEYVKGKEYNYKENKIILSDNLNRFRVNIFVKGAHLLKEERVVEYNKLAELYSRGNLHRHSLDFKPWFFKGRSLSLTREPNLLNSWMWMSKRLKEGGRRKKRRLFKRLRLVLFSKLKYGGVKTRFFKKINIKKKKIVKKKKKFNKKRNNKKFLRNKTIKERRFNSIRWLFRGLSKISKHNTIYNKAVKARSLTEPLISKRFNRFRETFITETKLLSESKLRGPRRLYRPSFKRRRGLFVKRSVRFLKLKRDLLPVNFKSKTLATHKRLARKLKKRRKDLRRPSRVFIGKKDSSTRNLLLRVKLFKKKRRFNLKKIALVSRKNPIILLSSSTDKYSGLSFREQQLYSLKSEVSKLNAIDYKRKGYRKGNYFKLKVDRVSKRLVLKRHLNLRTFINIGQLSRKKLNPYRILKLKRRLFLKMSYNTEVLVTTTGRKVYRRSLNMTNLRDRRRKLKRVNFRYSNKPIKSLRKWLRKKKYRKLRFRFFRKPHNNYSLFAKSRFNKWKKALRKNKKLVLKRSSLKKYTIGYNVKLIKSKVYRSSKSWYLLNRLDSASSNVPRLRSKRLNLFDYATFLNKALLVYQNKITNLKINNLNDKHVISLYAKFKAPSLGKIINSLRNQDASTHTYLKLTQPSSLEFLKSGSYLFAKNLIPEATLSRNVVKFWRLNKLLIKSKLKLKRVIRPKKNVDKRTLRAKLTKVRWKLSAMRHRFIKSNYSKNLAYLKKAIRLLIRGSQLGRIKLLGRGSYRKLKFNALKTPFTKGSEFVTVYNKKIRELKLNNHLLGKLGIPKLNHIELEVRAIKGEVIGLKNLPFVSKKKKIIKKKNKRTNVPKKVHCIRYNHLLTPVSNKRKLLGKLRSRLDLGYKVFYLKKLNILSRPKDKKTQCSLSNVGTNVITVDVLRNTALFAPITLCSMLVKKLKDNLPKYNDGLFGSNNLLNENKSRLTFSYFSTKLAYLLLTKTIYNPTINQLNSAELPIQTIPNLFNDPMLTECFNSTKTNLQDSIDQTYTIAKFLTKAKRRGNIVKVRYIKASYSSIHLVWDIVSSSVNYPNLTVVNLDLFKLTSISRNVVKWVSSRMVKEMYYEFNNITPTFFIDEVIHLIITAIRFRDASLLMDWVVSFLNKIQIKKHKKVIFFIKKLIKRMRKRKYLAKLGCLGFLFDIRGKVGVTGSKKKRHYSVNYGSYSATNKELRWSVEKGVVNTTTGVLGTTIIIAY